MQILLADAKIMVERSTIAPLSTPFFQTISDTLAAEMAKMDVGDMAYQLACSHKIAEQTCLRYHNFAFATKLPALLAYNGQAYKHLQANTLPKKALSFAQEHLFITSFLYGLLRPMDGIVPYRMEHNVRLEATHDRPISHFWKDLLTDVLIDSVKADDGILIHLSTEEYEHLFDWKRVEREVKVIQPLFYVRQATGQLKVQAVWAKTCRGAMARYILNNQLTSPQELTAFCYEGFQYEPHLGEETFPHFIKSS